MLLTLLFMQLFMLLGSLTRVSMITPCHHWIIYLVKRNFLHSLDHYRQHWHVVKVALVFGLDQFDLAHDVHTANYSPENGITKAFTSYRANQPTLCRSLRRFFILPSTTFGGMVQTRIVISIDKKLPRGAINNIGTRHGNRAR